jgi:hypothetical protein
VLVAAAVVAGALFGCQREDDRTVSCDSIDAAAYRVKGSGLEGDVDGDGTMDLVTLRRDAAHPAGCRHVLVVELEGGATLAAAVPPLAWPGGDPQLLLLADVDGRPGLEAAVDLSPANVYRPGAVFTLRDEAMRQLRREGAPVPGHFPFHDEFAAGVDCTGRPGEIVVTQGRISERGDRWWAITRTFLRADGGRFAENRVELYEVEVGDEAGRRWPEIRGDPFLSCPGRVG